MPCAERQPARPRSLAPGECSSFPSFPSAMNKQENFRQLPHKFSLQLRREHQVTVALILRSKRGEDPASYAEVGRPCVSLRLPLRGSKQSCGSLLLPSRINGTPPTPSASAPAIPKRCAPAPLRAATECRLRSDRKSTRLNSSHLGISY